VCIYINTITCEGKIETHRKGGVGEFPLASGAADYLLFVDRKAVGVIEAKPVGTTLSDVADQSDRSNLQSALEQFTNIQRRTKKRQTTNGTTVTIMHKGP